MFIVLFCFEWNTCYFKCDIISMLFVYEKINTKKPLETILLNTFFKLF